MEKKGGVVNLEIRKLNCVSKLAGHNKKSDQVYSQHPSFSHIRPVFMHPDL